MARSTAGLVAVFAALGSAACISVLGSFEVGGCPAGQSAVEGRCVALPGTDGGGENPIAVRCTDPGAPTCGPRQQCSDTQGAPACICKPEFAGEGCGLCAPGLQDNDGDGVCEAS